MDETKMDETKMDETKMGETKMDETKMDETKMDETKMDETKMEKQPKKKKGLKCCMCLKIKKAGSKRIAKLIEKFGSLDKLDNEYVCRDCRVNK